VVFHSNFIRFCHRNDGVTVVSVFVNRSEWQIAGTVPYSLPVQCRTHCRYDSEPAILFAVSIAMGGGSVVSLQLNALSIALYSALSFFDTAFRSHWIPELYRPIISEGTGEGSPEG
jgi:hypothetical protein